MKPDSRHSTFRARTKRAQSSPESHDRDIIYGLHAAEAVLSNPRRRIESILVTKNGLNRLKASFGTLPLEPEIVDPRELDRRLEPGAVHQGIAVWAAPLPELRLDEIDRHQLVVVLDQVTDPHNVGAILRCCAAFGVGAVMTTARHSPTASAVLFKSASGAAETVPFVKVTNLARGLAELKSYGFQIIGLDSSAEQPIESGKLEFPVALVFGAEGKGLRSLTKATCDMLVRLDLPGSLKSLNVSNAAALALYAVTRRLKPTSA